MEIEYAMKYINKYDKFLLDYYKTGQVKKLVDGIHSNYIISEIEKQSKDTASEAEIEQFSTNV